MFSPMWNSSRSSLASVGSSYHSWEEPELGSLQQIYDYEESQISGSQTASGTTTHGSDRTLADDNSEEILYRHTGLTKGDIAVIHTKLVDMALNKAPKKLSEVSTLPKSGADSLSSSLSEAQADTVVCFHIALV